jgi:transcriptional regulator with XRE-family HTH domain
MRLHTVWEWHGGAEMDPKYVAIEHLAEARLRTIRREQGMTQRDLADRWPSWVFSSRQSTVARVERGRRRLSLAEAHALMDILEQNRGTLYRRIVPLDSEGD